MRRRQPYSVPARRASAEGRAQVRLVQALEARLADAAAQKRLYPGVLGYWNESLFSDQENTVLESLRKALKLGAAEDTWKRLRFTLWSEKRLTASLKQRLQGRTEYDRVLGDVRTNTDRAVRLLLAGGRRYSGYQGWVKGVKGSMLRRKWR